MDKRYTGKFISKLREENKLTQEELADKLNVSTRKIKRLEKGKFKLGSDFVVAICKEFKISMYEFINGYKGNDNIDQIDALHHLSDYQKTQKRKHIIVYSIITIFFIFSIVWLHNNKDLKYFLSGSSESFNLNHAIFVRTGNWYYFNFGYLESTNPDITTDDITYYSLKSGDRLIVAANGIISSSLQEHRGYNEYFPDDVVKNLDNWTLEITYKVSNETKTEIINIQNEWFD